MNTTMPIMGWCFVKGFDIYPFVSRRALLLSYSSFLSSNSLSSPPIKQGHRTYNGDETLTKPSIPPGNPKPLTNSTPNAKAAMDNTQASVCTTQCAWKDHRPGITRKRIAPSGKRITKARHARMPWAARARTALS